MRSIDESSPDHGARITPLRHSVARVSLWAMVVMMGIQLGGGLYEHTSALPEWSTAPGDELRAALLHSAQTNASAAFWPFVAPALGVLAVLNAFMAATARGRVRQWWLYAALLELFNQLGTWLYFAPELHAFANDPIPAGVLEQRAWAWVRFDTVRIVLEAFAWSLGLAALTRWRGGAPDGDDHDDTVATG
jgi:hypothetical protein